MPFFSIKGEFDDRKYTKSGGNEALNPLNPWPKTAKSSYQYLGLQMLFMGMNPTSMFYDGFADF